MHLAGSEKISNGTRRPTLADQFPRAAELEQLPAPGSWGPYPASTDRQAWAALPADARAAAIAEATDASRTPWPVLTASLWARYVHQGDRASFDDPYFAPPDPPGRSSPRGSHDQ